jgi:hypothetical protein
MVSTLALTAAPLEAEPRPVLAMALVSAFCTELLAPPAVLDAVAFWFATAGCPAAPVVPPPLLGTLLAPAELEVPAVSRLLDCVPVAAPPEVLM